MDLPKISIVIPVYNVEPYIAECLQSVMRQTYSAPMECIVVDDCGNDKSMEIAKRLIAEHEGSIEFRVLHHEKNLGLSCARNTGINAATGDYIYFLDSDDYITDDCIDTLTSQLRKGDFDVIVGNRFFFGNRTGGEMVISEEGLMISGEEYFLKYVYGYQVTVSVWNKLYSRKYLKNNNMLFEPGLILEDYVYNFRLSCYPTRLYVIKEVTYHYRYRREGSIDCEVINNPMIHRDWLVQVWNYIRRYCEVDMYNEVHEIALHYYGKRVFDLSRQNNLKYKDVFVSFNKDYPYHPVIVWLRGKQNFKWLFSRLIWILSPLFAFFYFEFKENVKAKIYVSK